MCGIFGASIFNGFDIKTASKVSHAINELAVLNTVRGTHSTGIARIDSKNGVGRIHLHKDITPAHITIKTRKWAKVNVINQNTTFILGHTRFATHGDITIKNAHPFVQDHTVGIHNGIITNILQKYPELEVDSRAAIQLINDEGYEALSSCYGSAAIVTVDTKHPETIDLFKDGNPCHVFLDFKERFALFSSQLDHLLLVIDLIGSSENSMTMTFSLPEYKRISFNVQTGIKIHKQKIELSYYRPSYGHYAGNQWNSWDNSDYYSVDEWDTHKKSTSVTNHIKTDPSNNPVSFVEENEPQAVMMDLAISLRTSLDAIIANKNAFMINYEEVDNTDVLNNNELYCAVCNVDKQDDLSINFYYINEFACYLCEDCLLSIQEALEKETKLDISIMKKETTTDETGKLVFCEICDRDITAFKENNSKLFDSLEKKHGIPICTKCHKWMCAYDESIKSV